MAQFGRDVHNWTCESLWLWWMQIIWQGHTQWGQQGAGAAFNHSGTTLLFVRLGRSHSTPRSACWFREQQKRGWHTVPSRSKINPPRVSPAFKWLAENRLCFVKECTSPTRQVRVDCKLNHSGPHILSPRHQCCAKYPVCDSLNTFLQKPLFIGHYRANTHTFDPGSWGICVNKCERFKALLCGSGKNHLHFIEDTFSI